MYPYLGSSPDRIVDENIVLEIKCPYSASDKLIDENTVSYLTKNVDNKLILKRDHEYHHQIQGQMMCSNRKHCDFVVFTQKDFKVIRIDRDEPFINDMMVKLQTFYNEFYQEALLEHYLFKDSGRYVFQY